MAEKATAQNDQGTVFSPSEIVSRYRHFQELLLAARNKVLSRAKSQREQVDQQMLTSPGDVGDASVVDESADYYLSLAASDRSLLGEISDAMARIRKGTYGVCESCQIPIEVDRLERIPHARLCIDCQSAREARYATARIGTSRKI